jgi:hypothetical protein
VDRNGLILGVSAVLFGITVLMLIVGIVVNPFFLLAAVPFGASAYLLWYQASGKLADRIRSNPDSYARSSPGNGAGPGSFDAGPFEGRFTDGRSRRNRQRSRSRSTTGAAEPADFSPSKARRILDVDATADETDIKTAYRRKAKEYHPDTDSGDEEMFKKVSRAYETLNE